MCKRKRSGDTANALRPHLPAIQVALICLLAVPATAQGPTAQTAVAPARRMTVSASAVMQAKLDKADVIVSINSEDKSPTAAMKANADETARLTSALEAAGIAESDIRPVNFDVQPVYGPPIAGKLDTNELISYRIYNQLQITIRAMTKVATTLDTAIQNGASAIVNVSYGILDYESVRDEAMELAVLEARRKADLLAKSSGATIVGIWELNDNSPAGPPSVQSRLPVSAGSISNPMGPSQMSVLAKVTIVYELGSPDRARKVAKPGSSGPLEKPQTVK